MPTKIAATSSMPSMKRSMALRGRGAGASGGVIAGAASAMLRSDNVTAAKMRCRPFQVRIGEAPGSIRRLVLGQLRLQLLEDRVRITAGPLDVVGPGLLQRLGRLAPFGELFRRDRVDLVRRVRL